MKKLLFIFSSIIFILFLAPANSIVNATGASSFGNTTKYCPQGDTSGNYCGKTSCDNTGVNYVSYGISGGNCTYHSWNCSGSSCGTQYSDHYWSLSCDKTDTQRNSSGSEGGAGPTNPPRCIPPAPPAPTSGSACALNSTNTGYNLTWGEITHTTYNVYSGTGTLLKNVSTNSYATSSTAISSFTIKSVGGGRESLKGLTINNCPPVPTSTPSLTPSPSASPTPAPADTIFTLNLGLDGIWSAGDNANPDSSGSNKNPLHTTRNVTLQLYDSNNSLTLEKTGTVAYNGTSGRFMGTINVGHATSLNGNYTIKVKSDGYLRKTIPGIQSLITSNSVTNVTLSQINLIAGDIDNDNALTILDYNLFLTCSIFSTDSQTLCNSNANYAVLSDLDDNGTVDQFDYNLFVREYSVQNGQ